MSEDVDLVVAVIVGALQGLFEWLPVSSEGQVALALTALGRAPDVAVRFALVLHAGTGLAALVYYRGTVREELDRALARGITPTGLFVVVGTLVSGVVGIAAYLALDAVVTGLAGGAFLALVGATLVATGLFIRYAGDEGGGDRPPTLPDAVLVGALQGLAILPGVSRSGVTTGALLLRGYDGPGAFRLSFLLAIPASFAAGGLAIADGGVPDLAPAAAGASLVAAAVVGYLTIDALLRVARSVPFWAVCVGLGALAVAGGALSI